jgi:hypothetical protein
LIDERRGEQLCRIELTHSEAVEPGFSPARPALNPKPSAIPLPEIDAI